MKTIRNNPLRLLLMVSFLLTIVVISLSPFDGSLEGCYGDHLHYQAVAQLFLQTGLRVFGTPVGELAASTQPSLPHLIWVELPYALTLGNLLVFLPFGALNNLGILPEAAVQKLLICFLSLVAHIAIYYFIDELTKRRVTLAVKAILSIIFYLSLVRWSLNGFADAISILFIVLTIRFLREEKSTNALLCYAMSVFMHYRALYFLPLGIQVVFRMYREGKLSPTSLWRAGTSAKVAYGFTIAASILTIYTAYVTFVRFPYMRVLGEVASFWGIWPNPLSPEFFSPALAIPVFAATALAIAYLVRKKELLAASTVAVALLLLSLFPYFQIWHPIFLLPIPLMPKDKWNKRVTLLWLLLSVSVLVAAFSPLAWLPDTVRKWRGAL